MAAQFERDLRSANKEWKRTKDSSAKWSHGSRHLYGIRRNVYGEVIDEDVALNTKARPAKRPSEQHHTTKYSQNLSKLTGNNNNWTTIPDTRRRAKIYAHQEIRSDDNSETLPPTPGTPAAATTPGATAVDPFIYSFDRTDTPGEPLTLEVFVKAPTGRETERLVAREWEVVDGNGEAVKGRRAREVLRQGSEDKGEGEDEGFEIV